MPEYIPHYGIFYAVNVWPNSIQLENWIYFLLGIASSTSQHALLKFADKNAILLENETSRKDPSSILNIEREVNQEVLGGLMIKLVNCYKK